MEDLPHNCHQVDDLPMGNRPWQFTLRSMFILTTICAVLLSIGRMFPVIGFILVALLIHLVGAGVLFVVSLGAAVSVSWFFDLLFGKGNMAKEQTTVDCEQAKVKGLDNSDPQAAAREG